MESDFGSTVIVLNILDKIYMYWYVFHKVTSYYSIFSYQETTFDLLSYVFVKMSMGLADELFLKA